MSGQYKEWKNKQTFECMEKKDLKELVVNELQMLSSMSVEEYTLYRKWLEIQGRYPGKEFKNVFS